MMSAAGANAVFSGTVLVHGEASGEVIYSDVELSFWGGVDAASGKVIDAHHPLSGRSLAGKILAVPSSRGSCSGSGVILELLLNGRGPSGILFERGEDILTLGVVIAEEIFCRSIPVVALGPEGFRALAAAQYARIWGDRVECMPDDPSADRHPAREAPRATAPRLRLSDADRAFLDGSHGKAAQVAMKIILRMAELQGAQELIDVTQAHIDGCVYTGPGSLAFATRLRDWGAKVLVPTSLNSISVDRRRWRAQGMDPAFAEPASRLADAYLDMGAQPTFTCAPYLLDSTPRKGEQIVWAESNAVVYANSVLGARTMKYPDYLDICIALTGRAPLAGCHIAGNRHATVRIDLPELGPLDDSFYPVLGYHVGAVAANDIPVIVGLESATPTDDDLKAFGAAFATTSAAPMFHILGVTPEASTLEEAVGASEAIRRIAVDASDLLRTWKELNGAVDRSVDLVSLGNPHFSFNECLKLEALCRGRRKHDAVAVIVTCGRATLERARDTGVASALERFGVQFVTDTCWCMIVEPVLPPAARTIMTNSGKYAHYGPGLTGRQVHFGSLSACVEAACTGDASGRLPLWLDA